MMMIQVWFEASLLLFLQATAVESIASIAPKTRRTPELPKIPILGSVPFLIPSVLKGLGIGAVGGSAGEADGSGIKPDVKVILKDAHNVNGENFKMTMPGAGGAAGSRVINFVSNLEDTDLILGKSKKDFPDRGWLLDGLRHRLPFSLNAMPNDDKYKQHNKAIVQAFQRQNLDGYFDATVFETTILGKKLVRITDDVREDGSTTVDITDIVLEHVMRNFGSSVIGRAYTASCVKRLEGDSWQLQLGSLFDLVIPRWLRFGCEAKDKRAQENAREIIDATIKAMKIDTKRALRDAFAAQFDADQRKLTTDDINGFGGLAKDQYFKVARMDDFQPVMKDAVFSYITRARHNRDEAAGGEEAEGVEVNANLNMFMAHLERFIYDRIGLYYDIVKYNNKDGIFDLEKFILLLAPDKLDNMPNGNAQRELLNKIQSEIDAERPETRKKKIEREIEFEFEGAREDDVEKYLLRANLRRENSTLGNIFSEYSTLGVTGAKVQRIFGNSRSLLQNIVTTPSDRGLSLPADEVYDAITNSLLAGYFSTAMTATWALWKLAQHPGYQERIYKELKEFGGFQQLAAVGLSKDMKTSRAFIYESMRTFPTVPVHARRASKTTTLPSGFQVTKDELVFINNFNVFTDSATWGEDGDKFNPERWMEGDYLEKSNVPHGPPDSVTKCPFTNVAKKVSKYAFAPFGSGHRACPAPEFALSVIQLTLLKFVEETKLESTPGDVIPSIGFALGNIGGCHVKLRPRNT